MRTPPGFVLVVEDEMLLRLVMADAFEDAGYAVLAASSADEALPLLAERAILAVVTDVQMPGEIDGLRLAEIAAASEPERPLMICTGQPLSTLPGAPAGAVVYPKPCAPEVIVRAVTAALRARGGPA